MSRLPPSVRGDAHAYTRSDSPWIIDVPKTVCDRLVRYLSGGGMRAFGRTVRQEEIHERHRRFWIGAAAFGLLWLIFWIF